MWTDWDLREATEIRESLVETFKGIVTLTSLQAINSIEQNLNFSVWYDSKASDLRESLKI